MEGRYADVAGLGLIGLAVLAGAGLYADAAGPIGRAAAAGAEGFAGLAGVLIPPMLALLGVALVLDREPDPERALRAAPLILKLQNACSGLSLHRPQQRWRRLRRSCSGMIWLANL